MAISKFGKWALALAGSALISTAASANDRYNEIHDYVSGECAKTISTPAPVASQPVISPYRAPVTTMIPQTTYETRTIQVPVQKCNTVMETRTETVPVTTYVPSTSIHTAPSTSIYSSGYSHSTVVSTPSMYATGYNESSTQTIQTDTCKIEGTNQQVPCPDATGTTYAPYTGQIYNNWTITGGANYPGGTVTDGYNSTYSGATYGENYSSGTYIWDGFYTQDTLVWGTSSLNRGWSILDYTWSQNSVSDWVNSILDNDWNPLSPAATRAIIGNQLNTWGRWNNISINSINGVGQTYRGSGTYIRKTR